MNFNQLEARLQTLAPQYTRLCNQVEQAQNAVLMAEIQVQQAEAEYAQYAGYSSYGLDEEHQQQLERIITELRYRVSQAQSQLSAAEGQLQAIQSQLAQVKSDLRGLIAGYEQLKVEITGDLQKLEAAERQVGGLSANHYAHLAETMSQVTAAKRARQTIYQHCNTRIRQIQTALSEDEGKDPPVKVKTR